MLPLNHQAEAHRRQQRLAILERQQAEAQQSSAVAATLPQRDAKDQKDKDESMESAIRQRKRK